MKPRSHAASLRSLLAVALLAGACSPGDGDGARGAGSSSIVLSADEGSLWVTSPDDDSLVEVDATSLEVLRTVPIAGAPTHVAWAGGRLVVTLRLASEVAVVNPGDGSVARVAVPCGGTRAVVADADLAYLSCPSDDRVVVLDVGGTRALRVWDAPGRPTALALSGDALAVSMSRLGAFEVRALASGEVRERVTLSLGDGVDAVQVDALSVGPDGFVAAYQQVHHDGDRERAPEDGGYGSVVDGAPRIEPMLHAPCGDRYSVFDGGPRVFSGPSAIAQSAGRLWVVNRYTDNVAVLPCGGGAAQRGRTGHEGTLRVGRGPRGVALSADGRTAFVDVGFDHAVARFEADALDGRVREATLERRRAVAPARLSERGQLGRALFHDAVNTHLTPSGIVTCATCHPGGAEDGLSWFLNTVTVGPKLRRTPPAWGARPSMAPFHWDGEFRDAGVLAHGGIVSLMEGDALLVDTDAMGVWMAEMPLPPGRPLSGEEAAAAARGEALFGGAAGCAVCHAGADFVDGLTHDVVAPSLDPDGVLSAVDTPGLRGVRARPPYLHDGRAATLRDVFVQHGADDTHGVTSGLSESELTDLLTYLETL